MQNVLIMVDGEGPMASTNEKERNKAVENHYKWVDAAQFLGCHSIRVNAHGEGSAEEVAKAAIDGLTKLSEYAEKKGSQCPCRKPRWLHIQWRVAGRCNEAYEQTKLRNLT